MNGDFWPACRCCPKSQPQAGQRWIYSAGFNVVPTMRSTGRIDAELPDLRRLVALGARVAILSHQGSARDGTARHLDYVAGYLGTRLRRPFPYHPHSAGPEAEGAARGMSDGEIAVFGNTRLYPGEEEVDIGLARSFAALGDFVAVGGFAKAHRRHASNTTILRYRPGFAADGLVREAAILEPWAGRRTGVQSVAVLGGTKPEKTLIGLASLAQTYDLIVPGGVVLNNVLAALGYEFGVPEMGTEPRLCQAAVHAALERATATIALPTHIIVAERGGGLGFAVPVRDGVPERHAIVDFVLPPAVLALLRRLRPTDRAIVAGTPSLFREGHRRATRTLLRFLRRCHTLLLGGDTVAELPWTGHTSTGGGAALSYLSSGTCAVFEALRESQIRHRG